MTQGTTAPGAQGLARQKRGMSWSSVGQCWPCRAHIVGVSHSTSHSAAFSELQHSVQQYLQHAKCSPVADEEDLRQPQVAVEQALLVGSVADDVGYHYEKNGEHLCPHAIYPHCSYAYDPRQIGKF